MMMSGSKGHNAFKLRREASPLGLDKRYDFVTRETRTSSAVALQNVQWTFVLQRPERSVDIVSVSELRELL